MSFSAFWCDSRRYAWRFGDRNRREVVVGRIWDRRGLGGTLVGPPQPNIPFPPIIPLYPPIPIPCYYPTWPQTPSEPLPLDPNVLLLTSTRPGCTATHSLLAVNSPSKITSFCHIRCCSFTLSIHSLVIGRMANRTKQSKRNDTKETKRKKNCHRLFLEAKWKYILNSDSKMRVVCYLYTDSDNSFTKRLCIGRRLRRLCRRRPNRRRLLLILQRIVAVCPKDSCLFVQRRYPNSSFWSSFMLPKAPKSISSIFRPLDTIREINIPLRIAKQTQIRRKQKIDETLLFVCTELCWTTSISNAKHFRPFV